MRLLLAVAAALLVAPAAVAQGPPPPPPGMPGGLPPGLPPMPRDLPCPPGFEPTAELPCVPGMEPPIPGDQYPGPIEESGLPPMPDLAPGFLNRVWKLDAEVDAFDAEARVLGVTVTRLLNVPKRFRDDDDEIVDADTSVLLSKTTRVYDGEGDRVRGEEAQSAALDAADTVRVHGKVLPPPKWQADEDDEPVPTVRAKRVYVTG